MGGTLDSVENPVLLQQLNFGIACFRTAVRNFFGADFCSVGPSAFGQQTHFHQPQFPANQVLKGPFLRPNKRHLVVPFPNIISKSTRLNTSISAEKVIDFHITYRPNRLSETATSALKYVPMTHLFSS